MNNKAAEVLAAVGRAKMGSQRMRYRSDEVIDLTISLLESDEQLKIKGETI